MTKKWAEFLEFESPALMLSMAAGWYGSGSGLKRGLQVRGLSVRSNLLGLYSSLLVSQAL